MAVKVLIKRRFKEGTAADVFAVLNKLRAGAMNQPGYVTGETLIGHDDPERLLVISTWQSVENWLKWKEDAERKAIEQELDPYLKQATEYETYVFGTFPRKK